VDFTTAFGLKNGESAIDWPVLNAEIIGGLDLVSEYELLGVKFTGKERSTGWRECFAVHREDSHPSAAVNLKTGVYKSDGEGGEISGFFDFAARYGKRGSWIETYRHYAEKAGVTLPFDVKPEELILESEHPYTAADGQELYEVLRYRVSRPHDRNKDWGKTFKIRRPVGGGRYAWNLGDVEPVPYRLQELESADPDDPVWIVEGEVDADRLGGLGLIATTNHGGTGNSRVWTKIARHFSGRDVFILPDNDEPGRRHAEAVASALLNHAHTVKVVVLPNLPKKGDVSDWLDGGGDLDELGKLAYAAPDWEPSRAQSFEGSDGSEGDSQRNKSSRVRPWKPPRLKQVIEPSPFPLTVLPSPLAELCTEGARAIQCPVDYFGAAALALAGGAIGLSVNLSVKAHYQESPALYMAVVGPSGSKKTPVIIKILARPFYSIDRDMREQYQAAVDAYEERKRQYEVERKRGDAGPPPTPPVQSQLTLDDTTREAVADVHSSNPRGLVMIKDELTSWVKSLDAYRSGKGDDKEFWLKVNSGALVKVNRKGNKEPVIVPQPCVTSVGGLTPDMLPAMKGSATGEDGWTPRILFSYPEPFPWDDWTEAEIPRNLLDDWEAAIRLLWSRPMVFDDRGRVRPYLIGMDDHAKESWRNWVNAHRAETRSHDFPRSLGSAWSKIEGFAARLALILSQLHAAYASHPVDRPPVNVSALDVWGACKLADYFKVHYRRAMVDLVRRWDVPDDAFAAIKWFRHSRRMSFSERDIKLNFPGRFASNPLALADCLDWLFQRDCIRPVETEPKPGRPHSPTYEVNPLLLGDRLTDEDNSGDSGGSDSV
jgi:5S rRNA maturation endonuclease (ribonuclease M5)